MAFKTKIRPLTLCLCLFLTQTLANNNSSFNSVYNNIITIDKKNFYIHFKKPKRNNYSKIEIALLDEKTKKEKDIEIKVTFRNIENLRESAQNTIYKTTLIRKKRGVFTNKFRLIGKGFWEFRVKIFYKKDIYSFSDRFYSL